MAIKIGSFNLNNLFSRWDFKGSLESPGPIAVRKFQGKLVRAKPLKATQRIAERILEAAPDVLAVQEVEDKGTLDAFNREHLAGKYPFRAIVEGNDARLIDVGVLSKLPIGELRSYQHWVHPERPGEPVFRRDLLQAEILSADRSRRLFWVVVAHLKSQLVPWSIKGWKAKDAARREASRTRWREADAIARILSANLHRSEMFFLCGDFNDVPGSHALRPLLARNGQGLGLVNVVARDQAPENRWTTSHKQTRQPREFMQFDYVLVPLEHAGKVGEAHVARRSTRVTKPDGSDHDPVFCECLAA